MLRSIVVISLLAMRTVGGVSMIEDPCETGPRSLPALWLDVPGAPLVGQVCDLNGVPAAGLVNRAPKHVRRFMLGYAVERDGRVHVIRDLGGMSRTHGGFAPGECILGALTNDECPVGWAAEERKAAESEGARMVVMSVAFEDGSTWQVDKSLWPASTSSEQPN